ncbi:MAG: VCBS repeat-containing protein [Polyangiaceae bacterium]|nr:VCBS repeat-containing protein [Polyangiaceae bacterium]
MVITAIYDGRPTDFYWGKGDGTFELDAYHAGITTKNGWGVATADYDNDGDEDVFATKLFRNDTRRARGTGSRCG